MNGDLDLLMRAAKAAGLAVCPDAFHDDNGLSIGTGRGDLWTWNPLADDAHAIGLAVQFLMHIGVETLTVSVWIPRGRFIGWSTEPTGADPAAALRRAITRCAAALATGGKA